MMNDSHRFSWLHFYSFLHFFHCSLHFYISCFLLLFFQSSLCIINVPFAHHIVWKATHNARTTEPAQPTHSLPCVINVTLLFLLSLSLCMPFFNSLFSLVVKCIINGKLWNAWIRYGYIGQFWEVCIWDVHVSRHVSFSLFCLLFCLYFTFGRNYKTISFVQAPFTKNALFSHFHWWARNTKGRFFFFWFIQLEYILHMILNAESSQPTTVVSA